MDIPEITLDNIWKVYYYIALFATVLFVVKLLIFTIVGGDSEVIADFNTEIDTDCSFNFLSIQSFLAFLMGFGWAGYSFLNQFGYGQIKSFILALIVGIVFFVATAGLMFAVRKLEKRVIKDKNTTLNWTGRAYINFAPHGKGQVEIELNGQLSILDAINNTDEQINAFDSVKVVDVKDDLLYVEKIEK